VRDPEQYATEHAEVWPEIEQLLKEVGFTRYDIYLHGDLVISFMEVDDYQAAVERYNASPDGTRWEEHWGDQIIIDEAEEGTDWPMPLRHVWSLE
jgi:L-rhamnose mutarotase